MIIHEIHDLSNEYVINIIKKEFSNVINDHRSNYNPDSSDRPGNVFKILDDGRYRKGKGTYYVLENDGNFICSAGWNVYDIDPTIALVMTRMYVSPLYRGKFIIGNTVLPLLLEQTKNFNKIWLTVNENNKTIYDWFVRADLGLRPSLFNNWPEIYKKFKPIGLHTIYYTEQYVAEYKKDNHD